MGASFRECSGLAAHLVSLSEQSRQLVDARQNPSGHCPLRHISQPALNEALQYRSY
jgi:hypothetical protein